MCTSFFLGVLVLTGCHDKRQMSAADVECRERLPAGESESVSSLSSNGMSYAGFQLGESAHMVENRIAQHRDWIGVSRTDCGGVWFVRAGTTLRYDNGAVCDVHGQNECELLQATLKRTAPRPHVLTHMTYAKRFETHGRPTQAVVSDLKAGYGEPFWEYAARRSSGWPDLTEETSFIWTTHDKRQSARRLIPISRKT